MIHFARSRSREIQVNPRNSQKFSRNLITYMSVQHIWKLSQQIYLDTSSLKRGNNVPKLPGVDYVAKNWALAMMLKALPLVHFWSVLLLREQMMTSVRKTFKVLVWSAQNRSISSEFFLKITTKSAVSTDCFFAQFAPKIPAKLADFSANLYLKSREIWLFFRNLLEALHRMARSIRFKVNWLFYEIWHIFYDESKAR